MTTHNLIPETKVLFAFDKIGRLVESLILRHRYIPTDQKDGLVKDLHRVRDALFDAQKRVDGQVPLTPQQEKEWKKNLERVFPNQKKR